MILQQVELPELKGTVTQFDRNNYHCQTCSSNVLAPLPEGVPNSAFGPRLMGLVANLTGVFHLSKKDAKQLISDLYGIDVSDGSVINIEERVTEALSSIYKRIHSFVTESVFCKHFESFQTLMSKNSTLFGSLWKHLTSQTRQWLVWQMMHCSSKKLMPLP